MTPASTPGSGSHNDLLVNRDRIYVALLPSENLA